MRKLRGWLMRFGGLFNRERKDRELQQELESHIQMHTEDNLRAGMAPEEARRQAMIKFGGMESVKQACREQRGLPLLETLWRDLRYGVRMLCKNPGFTGAAVLTLALGVGVNTAIFNLGQGLLLRPVPGVREPERLVQIGSTQKGEGFRSMAFADFKDFKTQGHALDLAALYDGQFIVGQGPSIERLRGAVVSGNYFHLLGVTMSAGRALSAGDDEAPGASPVAVISFALCQRLFGRDSSVLGRTVILNGFPFTVVGVAGAEFKGTERQRELDVWVPMSMLAQAAPDLGAREDLFSNRDITWHGAIGRLRTGFSLAQAQTELESIARRLAVAFPTSNDDRGVAILPGTSAYQRDLSTTYQAISLLLGVAGLALLGACANVTNMHLARALARRREMGIRLALGASGRRLLLQILTENLVLTALVGVCSVVLAKWISILIVVESPASMELGTLRLHLDARVFLFAICVTLLTAIGSVIVPMWRLRRDDITVVLKESSAQTVSSRSPLRNALVIAQIALSVLLMVIGGLFTRTLLSVLGSHSALAVKSVLVATVDLGSRGYDPTHGSQVFEALRERILRLPGVEAASFAATRPFVDLGADAFVRPEGSSKEDTVSVAEALIAPDFFKTLGTSLHEGRDFDVNDKAASQPVLIVDEGLAERLWQARSAVGQRLVIGGKLGEQTLQVIGVVRNPRIGSASESAKLTVYLPYAQHYEPQRVMLVRSSSNPAQIIGNMRASIADVEPGLQPFAVRTLADELYRSVQPQRTTASLVSFFAFLTLVLAAVGIHSLVSWSVSQRTREFGVRVALGSRQSDIVMLVLKQAGGLLLVGLGTGAVLSLLLTPLLRHELVGVASTDPLTYASVLAVLALVGFVASYLPARRGSRVDPMTALRCE